MSVTVKENEKENEGGELIVRETTVDIPKMINSTELRASYGGAWRRNGAINMHNCAAASCHNSRINCTYRRRRREEEAQGMTNCKQHFLASPEVA